jgi:MoaA/NifB/PqqE/SkfB family radical SAM enzyme
MTTAVQQQLQTVLKHLYINPLEKCNLRCKICYTRKTSPILSAETVLEFIHRYQVDQKLETVTFCGGEVFALAYFPTVVNLLVKEGIFTQVITNGTIDRLEEFDNPNFVNLIVSLDGVPEYHDKNRGEGNFAKSIAFMKKAHQLGFHLNVFSIVTHQNLEQVDAFEDRLRKELGFLPEVTYHPRKPPTYLMHHPVSNIFGEVDGFDFLTKKEMLSLMKTRNVFPPKDLGCYQIAVMSDGKVYGCCEGVTPIGVMTDTVPSLITKLTERVEAWSSTNTLNKCLGCSQAEFMCGIKEYLQLLQTEDSAE